MPISTRTTATVDADTTAARPPAAGSGTRIHLANIRKDYGLPTPAVDDVTLTIEPGEFMTLLGPSGSGKTTTLNLIAGFETLSAGSISFDGADVSSLPPHKRDLGMLFQNYALFPHMTVAQNVAYPLRERKQPKAEIARKVSEVLELVQLTGRDNHYPSQLSGGQQQRVALARAIVFGPHALLLDEPLGALDRNLRAMLQQEIHRIHSELGSTFVFVTHDQEEAMNLSDRIALFNSGNLEQVGTPETLYQAPETLFTARFLGDSNAFEVQRSSDGTIGWEGRAWAVDPATVSSRAVPGADAALIVRPEDMHLTRDADAVPPGANSAPATVRDVEYMGAFRTAVLSLGRHELVGRARLGSRDADIGPGDDVITWWTLEQQHLVAR
jgi:putative spermidine/putrescine transport system ATP-binding protein